MPIWLIPCTVFVLHLKVFYLFSCLLGIVCFYSHPKGHKDPLGYPLVIFFVFHQKVVCYMFMLVKNCLFLYSAQGN